MTKPTDPRVLALAKARQQIGHEAYGSVARWDNLAADEQRLFLDEAAAWLRAAVEAGIAPLADRPSDNHSAVWLDEYGDLWGEYQTSPSTALSDAAILPLVWASEVCSSRREMEDRGITFRLIGWSH